MHCSKEKKTAWKVQQEYQFLYRSNYIRVFFPYYTGRLADFF